MIDRVAPRRDYLALAISVAIGILFLISGMDKIRDPGDFADNIFGFGILPPAFISPLALGLPPFEILCGLLMLAPHTRRVATLGLMLLSVVFLAALASALARGLTLDCGCFGVGAPSRQRMWLEAGLDVLLFAGTLIVYLRSLPEMRRGRLALI
jgi:putative oxidoreductase